MRVDSRHMIVQCPTHASLITPEHTDWLSALESLKDQIDLHEYDILIAGAGAWGLPLAVYAKRSGKIGYHLGGPTQILFGIKGRRWDANRVSEYYNEHWVRPLESETPKDNTLVEGGCYW